MTTEIDIAILGAGPTGLALALALQDGPWRVQVFDAAAEHSASDPRALALSEGSRQLLDRLDAWPTTTAISNIDISQQGGQVSAGLYADSLALPALGYVARYGQLLHTLRARAQQHGIPITYAAPARQIEHTADAVQLHLDTREGRRTVRAQLVVHAEGIHDNTSWQADYAQTAIVCEAIPTLPHHHQAFERFTPDGPLALLPLDAGYAVVRVVSRAQCDALMALDDTHFAKDLARTLGYRVDFSSVGTRSAFPLSLKVRPQLQRGREVWIGNAAQTLHPVSGQGFNLGLRDAWSLAEALHEAQFESTKPVANTAADPAANALQKKRDNATLPPAHTAGTVLSEKVLANWARRRQPDRFVTAAVTDGLVRLFSNDIVPLRHARDIGLRVFDTLPGLRNFVARRLIWGARGLP